MRLIKIEYNFTLTSTKPGDYWLYSYCVVYLVIIRTCVVIIIIIIISYYALYYHVTVVYMWQRGWVGGGGVSLIVYLIVGHVFRGGSAENKNYQHSPISCELMNIKYTFVQKFLNHSRDQWYFKTVHLCNNINIVTKKKKNWFKSLWFWDNISLVYLHFILSFFFWCW